MREMLPIILSNFRGESNWKTQGTVPGDHTESDYYGYVLLAIGIGSILAGLVALMVISRFAPKGTVLAIAAVFYLASFSTAHIRNREAAMLTGCMRMFGFGGGILGIVDLIRKRKPSAKTKDPTTVSAK